MAVQEQDYIFRISGMVAEMLQRVTKLRENGQGDPRYRCSRPELR